MRSITVTTTNNIEGANITKYIELVAANVVVGTHFFSDFAASFTDLFGGYSNTYQRKLDNIYEAAIDGLKKKAQNIGADAVVGMKIDFSEISGKGKSMFMISAVGMAVKLKYENKAEINSTESATASVEMLSQAVMRHHIIEKTSEGELPNETEWTYLLNDPIEEIVTFLLGEYLRVQNNYDLGNNEKLLHNNFSQYISLIKPDVAIKALYSNIGDITINLLHENKLFDAKSIITLIDKGNIHDAILCLSADKSHYSKEDLVDMELITNMLENLPNKGRIENVKGIFKESEKYICENGHKNNYDTEFCSECGLNIKGLGQIEIRNINEFKLKVKLLKEILH